MLRALGRCGSPGRVQQPSLFAPKLERELQGSPEQVQGLAAAMHPEDLAAAADFLEAESAARLLDIIGTELSADVLTRVSVELQRDVVTHLGVRRVAELFEHMSADDRVDLFQLLPAPRAREVLEALAAHRPALAEEVRTLAKWAPETAGGRMTTEFMTLRPKATAQEAIEAVRRASRQRELETIYYIYVCDVGFKLRGVLSLRDLILAEPHEELESLFTEQVVQVAPEDDQEQVAGMMARYDLSVVPVVNAQGRLLGVVTIDDVVDVVISEATEDVQLMGGMVPLEDAYFHTGWFDFVWRRAAWLVVLFFGQMLTATVMAHHALTLQAVASLVLFIPLIIATGGNAGAQSSSLIIRGLAVGEVQPKHWWRVLLRELGIGLALGGLLGTLGFLRALFVPEDVEAFRLAMAVGTSIIAVTVLGTLVGSLLPLLMKRLRFDPAVSSTPLIASVVDVLGLMAYFYTAAVIFRRLLPVVP